MRSRTASQCLGTGLVKATQGFTLIEIMVVIVIIAIGAALVTPKITGLGARRETDVELRRLALGVKLARSQSIAQATAHTMFLDPEEGRYWIEKDKEPDRILVERVLPEGLKLQDVAFLQKTWQPLRQEEDEAEIWRLHFRQDGTCQDAEIVLKDKDGERHTLSIFGLLGRAEIEEEDE